ncbi:unnamed protein product [Pieris macdunnoughi]|uniref:Uncharacterized protein n=1 Tax=Pieris macdunnoughi TaxID=345717 RepID=A0A821XL46_9NEOP|nr:unnamed protein product [Pieris macdunnoughi]
MSNARTHQYQSSGYYEKDTEEKKNKEKDKEGFEEYINSTISKFKDLSHRLLDITAHSALFILKFCLFIPKLTYVLRCSPLWNHSVFLSDLDNLLKTSLESILNVRFDTPSWNQASLPVRFGGLGVRKITSVALPAFLSSAHKSSSLVGKILRYYSTNYEIADLTDARNAWIASNPGLSLPSSVNFQRSWEDPLCKCEFKKLLGHIPITDRARLMAVGSREAGHWLNAYPSPNTGTLLDPESLRIAISLRLGVPICTPHKCPCGFEVSSLGHHGLHCQKSAGRFSRHAALNDIIRRSLASVNVPAILEPTGIARDDGKRPDGMSLIPWKMGRALVWDATCVDTFAPSHLLRTSKKAGAAAEQAEINKRHKYKSFLQLQFCSLWSRDSWAVGFKCTGAY